MSHEEESSSQSRYDVESVEVIPLLQQHSHADNHSVNPLEALLGNAAGFAPLLDIPPDADDETMVELAIALSLQEHELSGEAGQQPMHELQVSKILKMLGYKNRIYYYYYIHIIESYNPAGVGTLASNRHSRRVHLHTNQRTNVIKLTPSR